MKTITAKEFDKKFDNGEDISEYLDFSKASRPNTLNTNIKKVNVDFPEWVIESLDKEAKKLVLQDNLLLKFGLLRDLKKKPNIYGQVNKTQE